MCTINWEYVGLIISSLGSLVSAFIAWLVYQQGKKIKTLTDVVTELGEANKLYKYSEMGRIIVYYTPEPKEDHKPDSVIMVLKNKGLAATRIYTTQTGKEPYEVFLVDQEINSGGTVRIKISTKDGSPIEGVDFDIVSIAINGWTSRQNIFKNPKHDLNVGPPKF
jgi:hypothetical protein